MGYTPLFDSMVRGTLYGRWPDIGIWPIVLALADRNGLVDATHEVIAGICGIPATEVAACMARFCAPDPKSRSQEEGGARLVLVDPRRDWGWRVVNHAYYREKARKAAYDAKRVESGEDAARKAASRAVPTCPAPSRDLPLSKLQTPNSNKEERERALKRPSRRVPEDFSPDLAFALAKLPDMDVEQEVQSFRDCEFTKAHSDWPATWRMWVRRCANSGQYARKGAADKGKWY